MPKYKRPKKAADGDKELSRHRITADISQQSPHTSFAGVPLYYEDVTFTCINCGREELWSAEQQKWWYEIAKGYIFSKAIRCRACRLAIRAAHGGTPRRLPRERHNSDDKK
jgi:hypothetical protein